MQLLAIETATEMLSVALWRDGELTVIERIAPRRHASELLGVVDQVLAGGPELSGLDGVAVGIGPGSFTGVRIGVAAAQGLAFGAGLPLVGISSLASTALAYRKRIAGTDKPDRVFVAFDARMGEIYCGLFDVAGDSTPSVTEEQVVGPAALVVSETPNLHGIGAGLESYRDVLVEAHPDRFAVVQADALPSAGATATIAARRLSDGSATWCAPADMEPSYLRNRVAEPARG